MMLRKLNYSLCAFLMNLILSVCAIGLPLYVQRSFDADISQIALMTVMGTLGYIFTCPVFGRLCARVGAKPLMVLGCVCFGSVYFFILGIEQLYQVHILAFLSGVSQAMFWPALEVQIAESSGAAGLSREIGLFNVSWCTGAAAGSQLGGMLHDVDVTLPLKLAFLTFPMSIIVLLSPSGASAADEAQSEQEDDDLPLPELCREFMYLGWMANFAAFCTIGVMRSLFAPDVTVRLGFSGTLTGGMVATLGVAQLGTFLLLMLSGFWHYRMRYLFLVPLMLAVGTGSTSLFTGKFLLFAALAVIGLAAGMSYFSSVYYSLHGHHEKGGKAGVHEAVVGLGLLVGPMFGGWFARWSGDSRAPYAVCAVIAVALLVAQLVHLKTRRITPEG